MTRRQTLRNRPTLADMARAFAPVDTPLAQLAKGYVSADDETGEAVTQNIGGRWIALAPALEGLAMAWRRVLAHYRVEIDVEPLDRLSGALARGEEIPQALVAECQATVTALKRAYRRMDGPTVKRICTPVSIEILIADTPNTERKAA